MATPEPKKILIDISTVTMFKVLAIIIAMIFLFFIRDILLLVFVALILASALEPWIHSLQKYHIPRTLGILLIYVLSMVVIGGAIYLIIPPMAVETQQLAKDWPVYWEKISSSLNWLQDYSTDHGWNQNIQDSFSSLQEGLTSAATGIFSTVVSFFGGIVSFIIILVMTFYISIEDKSLKRLARNLLPDKYQPYFSNVVNRMQDKIGLWLRGQLLLSFIIFGLAWIGLSVLGVKYALVLALLAGITELIPYLGPFLGAVPAVFIAMTTSPVLALYVVLLYIIIQQAENHLIVPLVMKKTLGLNPIIIIVVILIGAKMAGLLGVLLSVPVTTAISVVLSDIFAINNDENLE